MAHLPRHAHLQGKSTVTGSPNCPRSHRAGARALPFARGAALSAALLVLGAWSPAAYADSPGSAPSTTLTVTANLKASCKLDATGPTLAFGAINDIGALSANRDVSTTFNVTCSNGATYTVYLSDGGQRAAGANGPRQMISAGTGADGKPAKLPYQLYSDSGRSKVWDTTGMSSGTNGSGGVTNIGSSGAQSLTVYGRIALGTILPGVMGGYSDTVLITVVF